MKKELEDDDDEQDENVGSRRRVNCIDEEEGECRIVQKMMAMKKE